MSENTFVLGHHDLDLTELLVAQEPLSSRRGLISLLSAEWSTCPERRPQNTLTRLPAVCGPAPFPFHRTMSRSDFGTQETLRLFLWLRSFLSLEILPLGACKQ